MVQDQHLPSMHSTLGSDHFSSNGSLPSIPQLHDYDWNWHQLSKSPRGGKIPASTIGQVVKSVRPASIHGLHTPPKEMDSRNGHTGTHSSPRADGQLKAFHLADSSAQLYPTPQHTVGPHKRSENKLEPFYNSYYSARPHQSPTRKKECISSREQAVQNRGSGDRNAIVSYLQIPPSINNSKGSLPEFAAQITCLFWFESSLTLRAVEDSRSPLSHPLSPLAPEVQPTTGFRKWVTTILSMTQVSQNVILLALMFIYRLKKLNPGVKGKVGSEFRLLTVALMLGNKFLDDNTYTNKTWAEVSGISVQEIHVMEVEFLSNMRYTLYASAAEWDEWHVKLGKFSDYFDKATQVRTEMAPRNLALPAPSFNMAPNSPTPPLTQHHSSPFQPNPSPPRNATLPHPLSMPPYLAPTVASPAVTMPEVDLKPWSRKRSIEDHSLDLPSKRPSIHSSLVTSSATAIPGTMRDTSSPMPRLPVPNLPVSSGHHYPGQVPAPTQLPMPTGRAMSTVFPNSNRQQPVGMLPSMHPAPHLRGTSDGSPMTSLPERQSSSVLRSSSPSPTSHQFPSHHGTPTGLSPSGVPIARDSPYGPIRRVNTLLVPPPSTSLQKSLQPVAHDRLHYQPLGRPMSERRTGVLPGLPFHPWSETSQMHHLPQPLISS